ncbi:MAG: aspartate aminotransferase family protein [Gemmatimonadaceae bacterium]|nr:aspartate aminotransferase family protein [Gemmatimonadaceae bacterium]
MPHRALDRAVHHAKQFLAAQDSRSVAATASRETLLERFDVMLPHDGISAEVVLDELAANAEGGLLGNVGGRFFAWVIGGVLPAAHAAEWLTVTWDQNAAIYATSPAASVIEEVAGKWLLSVLRLPPDASFAFTTGCQMAHFTALLAARDHLMRLRGWDVNRQGLAGGPRARVIASEIRHVSVDRALRFLGIGADQVIALPAEHGGSISASQLGTALDSVDDSPCLVLLNAGDLNVGAFDRFRDLIPRVHERGGWVHVDGAFGLFARTSSRFAELTDGMDLADSWATDCHKWLNVPQDCGFAAVRHREAHRRAMTIHDSYFVAEESARDQIDWSPEWSRRARGISVYAALRQLGRSGVAALIERNCDQCATLVTEIAALPGVQCIAPAQLNQGLVRFLDARPGATDQDHDARTDAVIAAINRSGEAFFGGVRWRGQRAMRISVVNWQTRPDDIRRTVDAVRHALHAEPVAGDSASDR